MRACVCTCVYVYIHTCMYVHACMYLFFHMLSMSVNIQVDYITQLNPFKSEHIML